MPGYFLPEDSQFQLTKLRDHVRFLVRLAQPRTQAEERAAEPKVRMGELALRLELLAEQVDLVLDALSYPTRRTDTTCDGGFTNAVKRAPNATDAAFFVTLEQLYRLTLLTKNVSTFARVQKSNDAAEPADRLSPEADSTLHDSVNEICALLQQIRRQSLITPTSSRLCEERAVYAMGRDAWPDRAAHLH